jgi:hypothetical protein
VVGVQSTPETQYVRASASGCCSTGTRVGVRSMPPVYRTACGIGTATHAAGLTGNAVLSLLARHLEATPVVCHQRQPPAWAFASYLQGRVALSHTATASGTAGTDTLSLLPLHCCPALSCCCGQQQDRAVLRVLGSTPLATQQQGAWWTCTVSKQCGCRDSRLAIPVVLHVRTVPFVYLGVSVNAELAVPCQAVGVLWD